MCTSGCGGGKTNSPRSATTKAYTPATRTRATTYSQRPTSNRTGSSQFGTPKIKFSGRT